MSAATRKIAEHLLLRAVRANVRRTVPGSVRLRGFALDWTERIKRNGDFYARSAYVSGQDVLELLEADLAGDLVSPEPTTEPQGNAKLLKNSPDPAASPLVPLPENPENR